jgi:hypothetical protein
VLRRFFPGWNAWVNGLPDPRDPRRIVYSTREIVFSAIFLFLFRLQSRRRLRYDLNGPGGLANFQLVTETLAETLPHGDTVAYFMKHAPTAGLETLRHRMVRALIRSRALERFRLCGRFYLVAVDGTGFLSFRKPHCPQCQTQRLENGEIRYHHPVLEAKLVCENGLAISLETEFITRQDGATKQDCELAAFYRLMERLRRRWPQLRLCLLLDGLYFNETVLKTLSRRHCAYIITFKEGSAPATYAEMLALLDLSRDNVRLSVDGPIRRRFRWVHDMDHHGQRFHVFGCEETPEGGETRRFVWATNLHVQAHDVEELSQEGGRLRWKIENEGFKTLKREGFGMEHTYCEDWNAAQNFYLAMQIAHILDQIVRKSNLLNASVQALFGSFQAFVARWLEAWRSHPIDPAVLERYLNEGFQIRFDSS